MKLQIANILELLDQRTPERTSHVSPLIALFGEELVLRLFIDSLRRQGIGAKLLKASVTTGKTKGPRLDAWISVVEGDEHFLYQAEVKNWAAYAYGSWSDPLDSADEELTKRCKQRFDAQMRHLFSEKPEDRFLNKVLTPMKPPAGEFEKDHIKPALLYWWPTSDNGIEPISKIEVHGRGGFNELVVFSTSLYLRKLRKLGISEIDLEMPGFEKRLELLKPIFKQ